MWKPWVLSGLSPVMRPVMRTPWSVLANESVPETSLLLADASTAWARAEEPAGAGDAVGDDAGDAAVVGDSAGDAGSPWLLFVHPASKATDANANNAVIRVMGSSFRVRTVRG
jgi:hypothetical protein